MTSLAPDQAAPRRRPVLLGAAALAAILIAAILVALLVSGGGGSPASSSAAARLVPSDALAYVDLQLGRDQPAVARALRVAGRLPDFPLLDGQGLARLSQIVTGGRIVDTATDISPWLGHEAAVALLDTTTATAGSLVVLQVSDPGRAARFVRGEGARPVGRDRGDEILAYPNGSRLALTGGWMLIGQDSSVRAALDVAAGAAPSLASSGVYGRALAGAPAGAVLSAYASVAGVRRVLSPQSGLLGALGQLLDQPALQGTAVSLVPSGSAVHVHIHSALDPSLAGIGGAAPSAPFAPTMQRLVPASASLLLDVTGLDRLAPRVLNAGSAAGVAGGIGPLLSRLGAALRAEGVNTADLVSIFHGESAVAIVPSQGSQTLVIVARAPDQPKVATELAELEVPLAHLFTPTSSNSGAGAVPTFTDRTVAGVTAHELTLSTGLQLDYAVFRGLVVISTGLNGIAAVARPPGGTLGASAAFDRVLARRPAQISSLVYANLGSLLGLGRSTGLTGTSGILATLGPDLARLGATGLVSTHRPDSSTTDLTLEVG